MIGTADADAMAAQLWRRWLPYFVHEVRTPTSVMSGSIRIVRAEADRNVRTTSKRRNRRMHAWSIT